MPSDEGGCPAKTAMNLNRSHSPPQAAAPAALFNKSLQATRDGGSSSASRFTLVGPACLSSGR